MVSGCRFLSFLFYCFVFCAFCKVRFLKGLSSIISSPPLSLSLAAAAVAVAVAALSLNEFDDDDDEDSFTRVQINTRIILLTFSLSNTIK